MRGYVAVIHRNSQMPFRQKTRQTLVLHTVNLESPPQPHSTMHPFKEVTFYSSAIISMQDKRYVKYTHCHFTNRQTNIMYLKAITFVVGQQTFVMCQIYEKFRTENISSLHWRNTGRPNQLF